MSENFVKKIIIKIFIFITILIFFNKILLADENINYSGPGDNKDGYETKNYTTKSLSLYDRKGKQDDLIKYVTVKQLGLPLLDVPKENPVTRKKIELGKKLFFDRRLS